MRDPYDHSDPFDHFDYFGDFDPPLDPHPAFRLRRIFRRKRRTVRIVPRAQQLADTSSKHPDDPSELAPIPSRGPVP